VHKPAKLKVLLALLLMLTIGGLGWVSLQLQENEDIMRVHQHQRLIDSQLQATIVTVANYLQHLELQLMADAQRLNQGSVDPTHEYLARSPLVNQLVVMDSNNSKHSMLFPLLWRATNKERKFLKQTEEIWANNGLFERVSSDELSATTGNASSFSSLLSARQKNTITSAVLGDASGWLNWYHGAQQRYIFWVRNGNDRLVAFDLIPARLLSDLINRLPNDPGTNSTLPHSAIRLFNSQGENSYQWGRYPIADKDVSVNKLYLSRPLTNWHLAFYDDPQAVESAGFVWLLSFLAFALALTGLVVFLYREQQRGLRDAEQRVSFVNQVSHELKTPLTNIRMYAELLEEQVPDDEEKARKYLSVINGESIRLSRLIENVLNFSRSQREKLQINKKSGVIDECVEQCLNTFSASLHNRGMQCDFLGQSKDVVFFDQAALEQILNNLLSNAEKYASKGGKINITSKYSDDQGEVFIQVRDYGEGVDKQAKAHIFKPFYRAKSSLTEGVSGTGIGLSIARELAQKHGGDLSLLESDSGCCFQINLDVSPLD